MVCCASVCYSDVRICRKLVGVVNQIYRTTLKRILCEQIGSTRVSLDLTQDKMAEQLMMDVRSYSDIDRGISMCGTLTFVLFLIHFCPNPILLLNEIQMAFEAIDQELETSRNTKDST